MTFYDILGKRVCFTIIAWGCLGKIKRLERERRFFFLVCVGEGYGAGAIHPVSISPAPLRLCAKPAPTFFIMSVGVNCMESPAAIAASAVRLRPPVADARIVLTVAAARTPLDAFHIVDSILRPEFAMSPAASNGFAMIVSFIYHQIIFLITVTLAQIFYKTQEIYSAARLVCL